MLDSTLFPKERRNYEPDRNRRIASGERPFSARYNPEGNNFNNFLKNEGPARRILDMIVDGLHIAIDVNKFPSKPYHHLIVPNPELEYNQVMSKEGLRAAQYVMQLSHDPSYIIGMNPWNWVASVNHLHLQGIYNVGASVALPVERLQARLLRAKGALRVSSVPEFFLETRKFEGKYSLVERAILDFQAQIDGAIPMSYNITHRAFYVMLGKPVVMTKSCETGTGAFETGGLLYTLRDDLDGFSYKEILKELRQMKVVPSTNESRSAAMILTKGGIDLNSANLNLKIKRDGKGVPLPVTQQDLAQININGLVPVIINIKSVTGLQIFSEFKNAV
jgi:hypothetical protein